MKKIKNKGSLSLEATLVTSVVFIFFIVLMVGGFSLYTTQSRNVNFNFETGRYVSTTGCSLSKLQNMSTLQKFNGYEINVTVGSNPNVQLATGDKGKIDISCVPASTAGDEFSVITTMPVPYISDYFPQYGIRGDIYVQEAD